MHAHNFTKCSECKILAKGVVNLIQNREVVKIEFSSGLVSPELSILSCKYKGSSITKPAPRNEAKIPNRTTAGFLTHEVAATLQTNNATNAHAHASFVIANYLSEV
jgi:hypothetical protein